MTTDERTASQDKSQGESLAEQIGLTDQEFNAMGEIGAIYYQQGELEKARTIFEGLVELNPRSAAAHAALGALYTRIGEDDRALEHLNRAIDLDPQMIAPYVNRAEVMIKRGQAEQAVADIRRAVELDPEEKDAAANRGRALAVAIAEAVQVAQGKH